MDALELIVDDGRPANAWRFFELGRDLLALLDELSEIVVPWEITDLRSGSAHALVSPPKRSANQAPVLRLAVTSLHRVQEGQGLDERWTPDAVRVAHRFVEHGQQTEGETDWVPPRLRLVSDDPDVNGASVDLTSGLGERLEDLQPFERQMPGAVRGELVGVNVSRGNRASLRLANKRVVRVGFERPMRDALKNAMYQQVELSGAVRQDGDGRVFHVKADEVRVLLPPEDRWADMFGSAPNLTQGMDTDEWLRMTRGQA